MREKWKVIERLLEEEYDIEVQASYEGWGAGYDPKFLPLTEMWARGEVEDVPEPVKRPAGVVFYVPELSGKVEDRTLAEIRHEIEYLLSTDLYLWRLGQREFYRFGFPPTCFVVLYSVLESIKTDEKLIINHPSSKHAIRERYEEILKPLESYYPHHQFSLSFLRIWLNKETNTELERSLYEYIRSKNREAYDILMEDLLGKYIKRVEESQELNYIDLLLDEARGRVRKDAHKGRIMTDLLKKLPEDLQRLIYEYKEKRAIDLPEAERKEILRSLKAMPDWMRDYLKQMSYIDLIERDVEFFRHFLPKTLEADIEHRGFLSFIIKGWEEEASSGGGTSLSRGKGESSEEDKLYQKAYGLNKEEFLSYRRTLKTILPYVESLKRRFHRLLPQEEEGWGGKHYFGKRLDHKSLSVEVPLGRGKIYKRREEEVRKELAFKLLIDISSSMKKEEKVENAIRALLLFSEVIESMRMPFSIDVFSDRVFRLKAFEEDYSLVKWKVMELFNMLGGGTNLEKALLFAEEDLEVFCLKRGLRGCMVVFSDGEPTRGLRGQELKNLINSIRLKHPVVGVGVGEKNYAEYYFEGTGISIKHIKDLPHAFTRVIENQAKRLLAFQ